MSDDKNQDKEKLNAVSKVIEGIDVLGNSTDKKRKSMVQRLKSLVGEMELALKKRGKKIGPNES